MDFRVKHFQLTLQCDSERIFSELCSNLHVYGVRRFKLISSKQGSVKGTSEKIQETYSFGEE